MSKQIVLTDRGLKQLEEELDYLKTVKRQEIADKIKQARSFGDLSENSEYDEAKNEQAMIESRIAELEAMLKVATVLNLDDLKKDCVNVGSTVRMLDMEYNEEVTFTIVGSTEADPVEGKISDESPVGKALIGHKVDDIVKVENPAGSFKILGIEI